MKQLFKLSRIKLEELLQDISEFTRNVYGQTSTVFSPASPWGQIMTVIGRLAQMMFFYIEDSITELNINSASRPDSIRGLARIAGHDSTRSISASGDIYLSYNGAIPDIYGENVIIPNYTKLVCKDNQMPYILILGRDEVRYNIFNQRDRLFLKILQGEIESQVFTGTGEALQSFEVNMPASRQIDNYFVNVFVNGTKAKKYNSLYDIPKDTMGYIVKTGITSGIDIYFGNNYFGTPPPLGSTILVEYLVSDGVWGNVVNSDGVYFEFDSEGYDENGTEIDLNTLFSISIATPISFGSDPEPTFLTRMLAPLTSRSFVLANTSNYIAFFEKFQYFSFVNAYTEYDETNWFIDNIIYLVLVPDVKKRMRVGENYFTVPLEKFNLTKLEKFKIQRLLEESGQKIVNAVVRFVDPKFKRYALNIYISTWKGYNKDTIRNEVIEKVSDYMLSFKRSDYLPKSDLIRIIEDIDGIDSVSLYFVSEDIENELGLLLNIENLQYNHILTKEETDRYKALWETEEYKDSLDKKLAVLFSDEKVKEFILKHLDENGDVVMKKNERCLLRGGWKDRNVNFYSDYLQKDKLSAVNVNFIKENDRLISESYLKFNMNRLKNEI